MEFYYCVRQTWEYLRIFVIVAFSHIFEIELFGCNSNNYIFQNHISLKFDFLWNSLHFQYFASIPWRIWNDILFLSRFVKNPTNAMHRFRWTILIIQKVIAYLSLGSPRAVKVFWTPPYICLSSHSFTILPFLCHVCVFGHIRFFTLIPSHLLFLFFFLYLPILTTQGCVCFDMFVLMYSLGHV